MKDGKAVLFEGSVEDPDGNFKLPKTHTLLKQRIWMGLKIQDPTSVPKLENHPFPILHFPYVTLEVA